MPTDLSGLPQASLSISQLQTIKESLTTYDFYIPEGVSEKQYNQLVAHTFSYLKTIQFDDISAIKEKELLEKACFIQCHLKDMVVGDKNQDWSSEKVLAVTAMASHLWYQGREDTSFSFTQSCLAHAVDLQQSFQDLLPKVINNYQQMFSDLPENQLHALAHQAVYIAQISNQLLTRENLSTIAHSFLNTADAALSTEIGKEILKPETELNSLSESLTPSSTEKPLDLSNRRSLSLDPSFEKATTQLLEQYRQQEHQLGLSHEKELNLDPELER